jgi:photosystem II stability/assembly factor-like uncharacterized protein
LGCRRKIAAPPGRLPTGGRLYRTEIFRREEQMPLLRFIQITRRLPSVALAGIALAFTFNAAHAGGAPWERVSVTPANSDLTTVAIVDGSTAVVTTSDQIFRSTDAGLSWTERPTGLPPTVPPVGVYRFHGISFGSPQIGIVVGAAGTITRTSDGGLTWRDVSLADNAYLQRPFMIDDQFGLIAGTYRTTDGGLTWTGYPILIEGGVSDIAMLDRAHGLAIGPYGLTGTGEVYVSSDSGKSWEGVYSPPQFVMLHAIAFGGPLNGAAVGSDGVILNTTDGGVTWSVVRSDQADTLYDVAYRDAMNALAVGTGGTILRSTDGGGTWTPESGGTTVTLRGVAFREGYALAAGDSGVLLRSTLPAGVEREPGDVSAAATLDVAPQPVGASGAVRLHLARPARVRLGLYDQLGREVALLKDGEIESGEYRIPIECGALPSGSYQLRLIVDGRSITRPVLLVH